MAWGTEHGDMCEFLLLWKSIFLIFKDYGFKKNFKNLKQFFSLNMRLG